MCGEPVDRGLSNDMDTAPCENCDTSVKPIDDPDDAHVGFKDKHSIYCTDCGEHVVLNGLHMGEYTDGIVIACGCFSLGALAAELREPELPNQWEIEHNSIKE